MDSIDNSIVNSIMCCVCIRIDGRLTGNWQKFDKAVWQNFDRR